MPGRDGAVMAWHACVVILTAPDGRRMLSSASLMTYDEASTEAASWQHTDHPGGRGKWAASVRWVAL